MQLLDGKFLSSQIFEELKAETGAILLQGKRPPHLAAILVGNNGASETYVASKIRRCAEVGYDSTLIRFEDSISQSELLAKLDALNQDENIDGIIVQLPLPAHISPEGITMALNPDKDVDGFHPENFGKVAKGLDGFSAATPLGILMMLQRYKIETVGLHCVVLGRSQIVGLPMAVLMQRSAYPGNATVTLCHHHTRNLTEITKTADILISAIGKPSFVTATMVKEGAIVVDVGLERVPDSTKTNGFRLAGDVDFDTVAPKCSYITPVPGGVGLMTICGLLSNTMKAYMRQQKVVSFVSQGR